jgi:hypothetical protein
MPGVLLERGFAGADDLAVGERERLPHHAEAVHQHAVEVEDHGPQRPAYGGDVPGQFDVHAGCLSVSGTPAADA